MSVLPTELPGRCCSHRVCEALPDILWCKGAVSACTTCIEAKTVRAVQYLVCVCCASKPHFLKVLGQVCRTMILVVMAQPDHRQVLHK